MSKLRVHHDKVHNILDFKVDANHIVLSEDDDVFSTMDKEQQEWVLKVSERLFEAGIKYKSEEIAQRLNL